MSDFLEMGDDDTIDWETVHRKLMKRLVDTGRLYGDAESLMQLKATVLASLLHELVEALPTVSLNVLIPKSFSSEQEHWLKETLAAVNRAVRTSTLKHAINLTSRAIDDLCTSKLAGGTLDLETLFRSPNREH